MEKKTVRLSGECFLFKAASEEDFIKLMDDDLVSSFELENAFFIETDGDADMEFKCDVPKSKDYIKAFIYNDGKVLGKYYLSTPQGYIPFELSAVFESIGEDEFMIFGKIYDNEEIYYLELDLIRIKSVL